MRICRYDSKLGNDMTSSNNDNSGSVSLKWNKKRKRGMNSSIFGCEEDSEDDEYDENATKTNAANLAKKGKFKEALGLFNELIARGCDDASVYEMKSQILMEVDRPFEAIRSAHRAVDIDPKYHIAWLTLGRAQINFGEAELALKSAEMAMKFTSKEDKETVSSFLREVRVVVENLKKRKKIGHRIRGV